MKSNLKLENRVQEISSITRDLKIIAKEFDIPNNPSFSIKSKCRNENK